MAVPSLLSSPFDKDFNVARFHSMAAVVFFVFASPLSALGFENSEVTLINSDFAELKSALLKIGGDIHLAFDGSIAFSETVVIDSDVSLDARGRQVLLDGANQWRHFVVTNGATLRLIHLTLANGRHAGADGSTNEPGKAGLGGAILNLGGTVELIGCTLTNNSVQGGNGGPWGGERYDPMFHTLGGGGYGGAIYSSGGRLLATNCVFTGNAASGGSGRNIDTFAYSAPGADAFGGAVYSTNTASVLSRSTFANNQVQAGEWGYGRPWWSGGRAFGGAFADDGASTIVQACVFARNQATGAVKVAPEFEFFELSQRDDGGSANGGALFHRVGAMVIRGSLFATNGCTGGRGENRGWDGVL